LGDLSKLAKDITDANRLASHSRDRNNRLGGRKIYGHHNNNRYAPYRGRNDFLSKGQPPRSGPEKRGDHKQTINIEVSSNDVVEFLPDLTNFHAGNLRAFVPSWRMITSDKNILDYVSGVKISFEEGLVPCQAHYRPNIFNPQEELIVRKEIKTLLEKGVIKHSLMNLMGHFE